MTALIVFYVITAGMALLMLLARQRTAARGLPNEDPVELAGTRDRMEKPTMTVSLAALGVATALGAVLGLHRGHALAWAWFGVAALWFVNAALIESVRRDVLRLLGDRGRVRRTPAQARRLRLARRLSLVNAAAFPTWILTNLARTDDPSSGYQVVRGIVWVLWIGSALAWGVVRLRAYLRQAHEPDEPLEPTPST